MNRIKCILDLEKYRWTHTMRHVFKALAVWSVGSNLRPQVELTYFFIWLPDKYNYHPDRYSHLPHLSGVCLCVCRYIHTHNLISFGSSTREPNMDFWKSPGLYLFGQVHPDELLYKKIENNYLKKIINNNGLFFP